MTTISPTHNDSILPHSKKIIKAKNLNPTPSPNKKDQLASNLAACKKYETFNNNQKINILHDLKKGLLQIIKLEIEEKDSCVEDLLELLPIVELKEYNKLLARVLTKHIEGFVSSPKVLTQWRKKIKGWIHNTGKPENRGNPLVPFEKLDNFRKEVIRILKNLPFRCFPLLRQNILKVLERFHKEDEALTGPQPFNTNVCSKHWWFNFMQRNQDIKDMWEAIPLEREGKKVKAHAQKIREEQEGIKIEVDEPRKADTPTLKTSSLHMSDPIFAGPTFVLPPPQPNLSRLFGSITAPEMRENVGARVPDPYFVSMKALEFLFASRDAVKKNIVDMAQNQMMNSQQIGLVKTEGMKTEENNVKEEINVKVLGLYEKEEDMTDLTRVSPDTQTIKTEETRVKIEVEPLPATMDSDSANMGTAECCMSLGFIDAGEIDFNRA